ncbi:type VI secretion system tip protein VgrG, partial [Pseudomonas chlororaphis]|nr:type VI secretion system tip protein VgrG [Pseudomonas chlororaphis]
SWIKIDAGGVALSGALVNNNSGGSPGSGTGATPLLPGPLQAADGDKQGELLIAAQRQALQRAALQARPVCEICQMLSASQ